MQIITLTQEEFADMVEGGQVTERVDMGVASVLKVTRDEKRFVLVSTTSERYVMVKGE